MHSLSLTTWFIHIATVLEWMLAIVLIVRWGKAEENSGFMWLGIAMIPNLISAMAAITWHIFDNSEALKGLVVLQSGLTVIGNSCLAAAAWNLIRIKNQRESA